MADCDARAAAADSRWLVRLSSSMAAAGSRRCGAVCADAVQDTKQCACVEREGCRMQACRSESMIELNTHAGRHILCCYSDNAAAQTTCLSGSASPMPGVTAVPALPLELPCCALLLLAGLLYCSFLTPWGPATTMS